MDDKSRNEMALFKFSLIAPLINGTVTSKTKDYLENICAKTYQIPDGTFKELSPNTVRRWVSEYRRFGLDGLKRKLRNDKGASRALTPEIAQSIKELKSLYPHKTATAIYSELLSGGFLGSPPVSIATVQRFLRKFEVKAEPDIERKRFVFEFANDCWQTDVLIGPYLLIDGKKKCTYLKIERSFRTFRMQFLDSLDFAEVTSLAELNSRFLNYAESIYNLRPHSSLNGLSPMERYLKDQSFFRFVSSKALLEQVFLHELVRKVNHDATIVLCKQVYEVPQCLIGRSVIIRFDPEDLTKIFLKTGEPEVLLPILPVQAIDNSRMVRKQNQKQEIDFATLYGAGVHQ
jgi:Homeodomain-like domain/Mu transposase, C-terminal